MKNSDHTKSAISSIWGSAVGMMALVGVFGGGHPVAMSVPPIAAGATTIFILKQSKDEEEKRLHQTEQLKLMESRLQTLETIVTRDEDFLLPRSHTQDETLR